MPDRTIVITEDEVKALRQIMDFIAQYRKETGKGDYFSPGGWAGEQLYALLKKGRGEVPQ